MNLEMAEGKGNKGGYVRNVQSGGGFGHGVEKREEINARYLKNLDATQDKRSF